MNTRNNQRSRLTHCLLKQAYLQLLHEKQTAKITVKDICQIAEVNRSTFYAHYFEPNDILKELEDETIAQTLDALGSIEENRFDSNYARSSLQAFLMYIDKNQEVFYSLLVENSDPHFRRKFQSVALEVIEKAFRVIFLSDDYALAYRYIVGGSMEIVTDWIKNGCMIPERTICDILYRLSEGCLEKVSTKK